MLNYDVKENLKEKSEELKQWISIVWEQGLLESEGEEKEE